MQAAIKKQQALIKDLLAYRRIFLFGGAVRDMIRGELPNDYDVACHLSVFLHLVLQEGFVLKSCSEMKGISAYGGETAVRQWELILEKESQTMKFQVLDVGLLEDMSKCSMVFPALDYDVNGLVMPNENSVKQLVYRDDLLCVEDVTAKTMMNLCQKKMSPIRPTKQRALKMFLKGWGLSEPEILVSM